MAGVDLLFGPLLIGAVLNMMLYGIMSIQMFAYYQRYMSDSAWLRYLMLYLFIVETGNVVVQVGIIYEPLIIQYGQEVALRIAPKLLPGDSILIAIVSGPIQLFTAWRISVITGSFIVPALIALLSLASMSGGILVSVMVAMHPEFQQFQNITTEVIIWLVLSAACDVVIAIAMTHALYTRRTGFGAVDGQINRIVRLSVETGAITAITALVDVLLFILFPKTLVNFIVDFPLSNLYTCSMLAMLNSRPRRKVGDTEHAYTAPQIIARTHQSQIQPQPSFNKTKSKLEVYTSTEKLVATDSGESASDRSIAPHSDFYNYNSQTLDVPRPKPTRLEMTLDVPKPRAAPVGIPARPKLSVVTESRPMPVRSRPEKF
ncbi:hypothetical protein DFH09DRAFT_1312243 [Mycena vulgaris]|nr:hypothetical protein DFH09DRAFT_1312243 [Mycena vulgaris]